mgnify:CR=1 FL=1
MSAIQVDTDERYPGGYADIRIKNAEFSYPSFDSGLHIMNIIYKFTNALFHAAPQ